jgi:hypothetical protein
VATILYTWELEGLGQILCSLPLAQTLAARGHRVVATLPCGACVWDSASHPHPGPLPEGEGEKRQDRALNRAAGADYPARRAIRLKGITSGASSWQRNCMT